MINWGGGRRLMETASARGNPEAQNELLAY